MAAEGSLLCQRILSVLKNVPPDDPAIDLVDIHWHELPLRALRRRSRGGRTVRILLPADQQLEHGAVLIRENRMTLALNLLACDALVIRPRSAAQAAQIAYAIGNLHLPAQVGAREIVLPADDATEAALGRLGVQYGLKSRRVRISDTGFPPVTVAATLLDQKKS
jgi:urease accessory protein